VDLWQCDECLLKNFVTNNVCQACFKAKPGNSKTDGNNTTIRDTTVNKNDNLTNKKK